MMKREPYRVLVWGPGALGCACLRELVRREDLEVVGVLGYSPSKEGVDVGELIGQPPIGVAVTTDKERAFALDADAVLYTGMLPFDAATMESDVVRLLESGKNVISATAFHYAHNRGDAYVEKFETACRRGNSCLHGTGENPGFWFERVALTLAGACNDVEQLKLYEFADLATSGSSQQLLEGICFGLTAEEAAGPGPMDELWKEYYFVEILNMGSIALFGQPLDRVVHEPTHYVAETDIVLAKSQGDPMDMKITKGHVSAMTHSFTGYLDDRPRLSIAVNWFLRAKNSPFPVKSEHSWRVELEGRPVSLRCDIGAFASLEADLEFRPGDNTTSTYYLTAVTMVQAIPVLCGHEPGIVYPSVFAHATTDLRTLEGRRSVVG